jgi:hypothetical protein
MRARGRLGVRGGEIGQYSLTSEEAPGTGGWLRATGWENALEVAAFAEGPPNVKCAAAGAAAGAAADVVAGKVDDGPPNVNAAAVGAAAGAAAAAGAVNAGGAVPKENAGMVVAAEASLLAVPGVAAPNTNGAPAACVDGTNAPAAAESPPNAGGPSAGVEAGVGAAVMAGVETGVPIADDGAPKLNTGVLLALLAAALVSGTTAASGEAPKDSAGLGAGLAPAAALDGPSEKNSEPMTPNAFGSAGFGAAAGWPPLPKLKAGVAAVATASGAFVVPNVGKEGAAPVAAEVLGTAAADGANELLAPMGGVIGLSSAFAGRSTLPKLAREGAGTLAGEGAELLDDGSAALEAPKLNGLEETAAAEKDWPPNDADGVGVALLPNGVIEASGAAEGRPNSKRAGASFLTGVFTLPAMSTGSGWPKLKLRALPVPDEATAAAGARAMLAAGGQSGNMFTG